MKKPAWHLLAKRLARRWNADDAQVLADHLEERGFDGFASYLREGPSSEARAAVEAYLEIVTGTVAIRTFWQLDWLPGYTLTKHEWRQRVKCYGRNEARQLLKKARQQEPVDAL